MTENNSVSETHSKKSDKEIRHYTILSYFRKDYVGNVVPDKINLIKQKREGIKTALETQANQMK